MYLSPELILLVWSNAEYRKRARPLALFTAILGRSRRLTPLGQKFGAVGVTIITLGKVSDAGLTVAWARSAWIFVRVNVEGGVFALAASLLPYPRFATRDGALRAQVKAVGLMVAVCVVALAPRVS